MYVKYNATLRAMPSVNAFFNKRHDELCMGNRYETTLHLISGAITKLGRIQKAQKLFRAPGGVLPDTFWDFNAYASRGGVEFAFMSATPEREVAAEYAARSPAGVLFEIHQAMVDRGADLSWLSQYPAEKEVTFPPLTALEVRGSRIEDNTIIVEMTPRVVESCTEIEPDPEELAKVERKRKREALRSSALELAKAAPLVLLRAAIVELIKLAAMRAWRTLSAAARAVWRALSAAARAVWRALTALGRVLRHGLLAAWACLLRALIALRDGLTRLAVVVITATLDGLFEIAQHLHEIARGVQATLCWRCCPPAPRVLTVRGDGAEGELQEGAGAIEESWRGGGGTATAWSGHGDGDGGVEVQEERGVNASPSLVRISSLDASAHSVTWDPVVPV